MSYFSNLHPLTSAIYFISVLVITMFSANPILLMIALFGGILFYVKSGKNICLHKEAAFFLILFLIVAITNPLFSHNGVTPLFFLNGNPITLEALLYGSNLGIMLLATVFWFKCLNNILTGDKLLFLLGKVSPKIALLLSTALHFIPLFQTQADKIRQSQKAMGLFASDTWTDKLKGTVRMYSSLITWALENAIDTGSAMKSRGYGLKGRSHYSLFRFRKSDMFFLSIILVLDFVVFLVLSTGTLEFVFYPAVSMSPITIYNMPAVLAFAALCFLPFILEVKESLQWKYYRSKI